MKKTFSVAALSLMTTAAFAASDGQTDWQKEMSSAQTLNHLHHINQKEIELTKMAVDKNPSSQVKEMASHMLKDHEQMESQVEKLAKEKNIKLTKFQPATHEKVLVDRLNDLTGSQYQMAFMKTMMKGHEEASVELKKMSAETSDPQIKSLIQSMAPRIKEHLDMSKDPANRGVASTHSTN